MVINAANAKDRTHNLLPSSGVLALKEIDDLS